jgi:hypothetical protein
MWQRWGMRGAAVWLGERGLHAICRDTLNDRSQDLRVVMNRFKKDFFDGQHDTPVLRGMKRVIFLAESLVADTPERRHQLKTEMQPSISELCQWLRANAREHEEYVDTLPPLHKHVNVVGILDEVCTTAKQFILIPVVMSLSVVHALLPLICLSEILWWYLACRIARETSEFKGYQAIVDAAVRAKQCEMGVSQIVGRVIDELDQSLQQVKAIRSQAQDAERAQDDIINENQTMLSQWLTEW